jgi:hypothetical protein
MTQLAETKCTMSLSLEVGEIGRQAGEQGQRDLLQEDEADDDAASARDKKEYD